MRVCAFDLEIVKEIPSGCSDWKSIRPLGISCAATICSGDSEPKVWFHGQDKGRPLKGRMTLKETKALVIYLKSQVDQDVLPLTWNGLQFDFDVLAEESHLLDECKYIASKSIDMMFHIFCVKGFPLGLDVVAKSMNLSGKMEGMSGALAPQMWKSSASDRLKVLEYVGQDAKTTLEVYDESLKRKSIQWTSKSGKLNYFFLPNGRWFPVTECKNLPVPDTSWMSNPFKRESFYSWMGEAA